MIEYEIENIPMQRVIAKVCDVCNTRFDTKDELELQEFVSIYHDCGYASIFGDGNAFSIDICQHCFTKIINQFNIKLNYDGDVYE